MSEKISIPISIARFYMDEYEKNPNDTEREYYLTTTEFNLEIARSQGESIEEEYQRLEKLVSDLKIRKLHGSFFN